MSAEKRATMRWSTPAERVAFVRETVAWIDRLVEEVTLRRNVVDDIWLDLVGENTDINGPPGDILAAKVMEIGTILENVLVHLGEEDDFPDGDWAEVESRLGERAS